MAGKETPRQKMINMMYLIFIAMLALNLSKQILQSFGTMNEELTETNVELVERNSQFMQGLEEKAIEQAEKYLALKMKADSIRNISTAFYNNLVVSLDKRQYQTPESSPPFLHLWLWPPSHCPMLRSQTQSAANPTWLLTNVH